jgi:large subunit ribosomal protein L20
MRILAGVRILKPILCNLSRSAGQGAQFPLANFNRNIVRGMANHRHKKVIKLAKGYKGRANSCFKVAKLRVMKARQYAYRDRKVIVFSCLHHLIWRELTFLILIKMKLKQQVKKRDFRTLWIQRINAACRIYGVAYSSFIHGLNRSNIKLNRKVLSDIAITEPLSFRSVIEVAKASLNEYHASRPKKVVTKEL